jgi:hypothetical protein
VVVSGGVVVAVVVFEVFLPFSLPFPFPLPAPSIAGSASNSATVFVSESVSELSVCDWFGGERAALAGVSVAVTMRIEKMTARVRWVRRSIDCISI